MRSVSRACVVAALLCCTLLHIPAAEGQLLEDYLLFAPKARATTTRYCSPVRVFASNEPIHVNARGAMLVLAEEWLGGVPSCPTGLGMWSAVDREFSPGEGPNALPGLRYDCVLPRVPLPGGSVADFFRGALVEGYRSLPARTNDAACFVATPLTVRYASKWSARIYPPEVRTFVDDFVLEAVQVEVFREPLYQGPVSSVGGSGLWMTYWFARQLGLVAFTPGPMYSRFGDSSAPPLSGGSSLPMRLASPLFVVTDFQSEPTQPPPLPEAVVVEYRNTLDFPASPGGQFFYTDDPTEQAFVDSGAAGRFVRTGRSFAVGGYVPVCRFYGSVSPGPNSHFFSASPEECRAVKNAEVRPRPTDRQQWNSEGTAFYAVLPMQHPDTQQLVCIPGTLPVYRAYNNAYRPDGTRSPWDSNHRYSTQAADIETMVRDFGWRSEGLVFCVPAAM